MSDLRTTDARDVIDPTFERSKTDDFGALQGHAPPESGGSGDCEPLR